MAADHIEREVKLPFDSAQAARTAIVAAGATVLRERRLQDDVLFDSADRVLAASGCALRLRTERREHAGPAHLPDLALVTFKGPVQPGTMKVREERETRVDDAAVMARVFDALGMRAWFRYQKFREEFAAGGATIAIDETPVGTFVEIEGSEDAVLAVTASLGRSPSDFILDSYRTLFLRLREQFGLSGDDMVFDAR